MRVIINEFEIEVRRHSLFIGPLFGFGAHITFDQEEGVVDWTWRGARATRFWWGKTAREIRAHETKSGRGVPLGSGNALGFSWIDESRRTKAHS